MNTGRRYIGKYELHEHLGSGGTAEVWKAFDPQLQRYVAIKLLHAHIQHDHDFIRRFEREARAIASLQHPNIVRIHDFYVPRPPATDSSIAYMVMEYIEGQTLANYIRNTSYRGHFPQTDDIIHLFTSISLAIDYAHQHGIVHRDIKPDNILLDKRNPSRYTMGEPILTDFGIVKLLKDATSTLNSVAPGTPRYISPEQAQGHSGNERSDIYSLSVVLYEVCTGVQPFQGDNPNAIMMQHVNSIPTLPELINPKITPALSQVILRGLAKDPAARFPTASSLAVALAQASSLSATDSVEITQGVHHQFIASMDRQDGEEANRHSSGNTRTLYKAAPDSSPISPQLPHSHSFVQKRQRRVWVVMLLALLLVLLTGSSFAAFNLLSHHSSVSPGMANSLVGSAFFVSSERLGQDYSQGINDRLQMDLKDIPNPTSGKSYYAWLLSDRTRGQTTGTDNQSTPTFLLLGKLLVISGKVHFLYPGNQKHSDLLATFSRLLITEEDANVTPERPSPDYNTWRYYAELTQIPDPIGTHGRALDTLRILLSEGANLNALGIHHSGLDIHFLRNVQQIWEWARDARNEWNSKNPVSIRDQIIHILDYLDGASLVKADVPPATPLLVDQTFADIPLLNLESGQELSSYIVRISGQLVGLANIAGVTTEMRQTAIQADADLINNVEVWLKKVHMDAKSLVNMTDMQLLQSAALSYLNDMETQTGYAYNGYTNLTTGKLQAGTVSIDSNIQRLTTFDITRYIL